MNVVWLIFLSTYDEDIVVTIHKSEDGALSQLNKLFIEWPHNDYYICQRDLYE